ncbi:siderophore ABC transporter substrate-binding protein [Salinibius halmophilus]|uniref:siderophore ABC transporter substrate-binding protein n=1 Tax=Salinibius halmophilus TaxID=1853216 RepID=UPI0018F28E79|nr:siderophore ABC transporter substrate-binding protein [Salinibius halmophilus]
MRSIIAGAALLTAAFANADITVEHYKGTTTLAQVPEKIVTFDIASLDTLDFLGVQVVGLPQDFVPSHLSHYEGDEYTSVGSLFEPNYEVVASLQPDLIITANRSLRVHDDLAKIAPAIDLTVWVDEENPSFLGQFGKMSRALGQAVGKEAAVDQQLEVIQSKVEATRALADDAGNALIVLTNGGKVNAYGPGSRFGWIHDELNVKPVIEDVEAASHGDPISFEFILEHNPDYLFVLDRDGAINPDNAAAKATLDNDLIKATKAYQNGNIVYLNSTNWYIVMNGLGAVEQMVDEIHSALE